MGSKASDMGYDNSTTCRRVVSMYGASSGEGGDMDMGEVRPGSPWRGWGGGLVGIGVDGP